MAARRGVLHLVLRAGTRRGTDVRGARTTEGFSMSGKIRAAFAVALAAAGLTGCAGLNGYSVRDETAAQQDVIGDVVHLGATLCLDDESTVTDTARIDLPAHGDGACDASTPAADYAQGFSDNGGVQF